jgi:hypothetical protein
MRLIVRLFAISLQSILKDLFYWDRLRLTMKLELCLQLRRPWFVPSFMILLVNLSYLDLFNLLNELFKLIELSYIRFIE